MLIFNGSSFGQGAGGEGAPPPAPSWNFGFRYILFDAEYSLAPQQAGPPIVPPQRKISSTRMYLDGGKIFNVTNIVPIQYEVKVFDSGTNLIWSGSFQYQAGGTIHQVDGPTPNGALVSPPVTIRVDLKSNTGIWYEGNPASVGSATETTNWQGVTRNNWRVDTSTTWSYKIPTPQAIPNMRVALENIKNQNIPWELHKNVWESSWNADSSFGKWSFDEFYVEEPYRFTQGQAGYGGGLVFLTKFMSAILAKDENPVGILYYNPGNCLIGP